MVARKRLICYIIRTRTLLVLLIPRFLVLLYQILELYATEWGIVTALTTNFFILLVPQIFTFKLLLQ